METLRHRLRQLRKEKGWTLKKTQEVSGVGLSYLSAIENGRRRAGRETIRKLVVVYADSEEERERLWSELLQLPQLDREGDVNFPPLYQIPIERREDPSQPPMISAKYVAKEVEDYLQVLGCPIQNANQPFPLLEATNRDFLKQGREIKRVLIVGDEEKQYTVTISVCRLEQAVKKTD